MTAQTPQFLRRKDAGVYLKTRYGFSSELAHAKLATVGGSPPFHRAGTNGRIIVYEISELDSWALTQIGQPLRSTADGPRPAKGRHA
jgi:hypothetical protein